MMADRKVSLIMALWSEGFLTESEVISWADKMLLGQGERLSDSLVNLSLSGPSVCYRKPSHEFPPKMELSFEERFSVRLSKLDLKSVPDVKKFIRWAATEAMSEDYDSPEVQFSYQLDHYLDYDEIDPVVYFERNIDELMESALNVANSILRKAEV